MKYTYTIFKSETSPNKDGDYTMTWEAHGVTIVTHHNLYNIETNYPNHV